MNRKSSMICILAILIGYTRAFASDAESVPVFTSEERILAVSREDQSNAVKIGMVNREVLLTEVIKVLTTYRKVTENQYMIYAHQIGLLGTATLYGDEKYTWSIEPGYAATVKSEDGEVVYLLHPELKTEPSAGENASRPTP